MKTLCGRGQQEKTIRKGNGNQKGNKGKQEDTKKAKNKARTKKHEN